ncbi:MAG TPA: hypothetical protein VJC14_00930 [Candidatus Paceibacterota bacterium]
MAKKSSKKKGKKTRQKKLEGLSGTSKYAIVLIVGRRGKLSRIWIPLR